MNTLEKFDCLSKIIKEKPPVSPNALTAKKSDFAKFMDSIDRNYVTEGNSLS